MLLDLYLDVSIMDLMTDIFLKLIFAMMVPLVFPKHNRFGLFPSFSFGWRISEENFFKVDFVDNLKLRASWGQLGNQEIDDYLFYDTYSFGYDYSFGNTLFSGISINDVMANSAITWEKTDQIDVGIDADFGEGNYLLLVTSF